MTSRSVTKQLCTEKRERMRVLKSKATEAKNILMRIERDLSELSLKESRRLNSVIGRLESWQNS